MAAFQMQIATEHPVLFLADDAGDIAIPDAVGQAFVAATDNCLCFRVLASVDGASVVTVADDGPISAGSLMFAGSIQASSGTIAVSDSLGFCYLRIPVRPGRVTAEVWANDAENPDWVWVKLGDIRSY